MSSSAEEIALGSGGNVLLIQIRAMGDTLLTTPLIRDFKLRYPAVNIDILVEPLPAQVLTNNPNISEIKVSPQRGSSWSTYIPLLKDLRRKEYKLVVDLISTPGSALIARLSGARFRIGYRLRWRSWAYTLSVQRRRESLYSPLTKYDLTTGLDVRCSSPIPQLFPGDDNLQRADDFLKKYNLDNKDRIIGIAPWSKRVQRRWDTEAWLKLMKTVDTEQKYRWLLFTSASERESVYDIEKSTGFNVIWVGAEHILDAASIMSSCKLVVGSDNGLMHIAVALSIPTLTIFQPHPGVDPGAWTPPGYKHHDYLIAPADKTDLSQFLESIESKTNRLSDLPADAFDSV